MKINELKSLIRETISKVLNEAQPAPSKPAPGTKPTVHPGKPGTDKPKPRRPLGNPEVKPNPKNPRIIKDEKFKKLVKSIQEFPEYFRLNALLLIPPFLNNQQFFH